MGESRDLGGGAGGRRGGGQNQESVKVEVQGGEKEVKTFGGGGVHGIGKGRKCQNEWAKNA